MKSGLIPYLILVSALIAQEPETRPIPAVTGKKDQTQKSMLPQSSQPLVQVMLEFIEVPQTEATRLLYKEKLGKDGTKLRAELQIMMDSQKASAFETMMVAVQGGQKAKIGSVREVIYPAEYEPPGLPGSFGPTATESTNQVAKTPLTFAPTPTAFETRNTGSVLEIRQAIVEDGAVINLTLSPEIVFDAGSRRWNSRKDELGNESAMEMPYFYVISSNTNLNLLDGLPQLLAVLTPKDKDGIQDQTRKMFVIVTADIVRVKAKP
jgi:hypothetical protein